MKFNGLFTNLLLKASDIRTVRQIDFVPTIALLLGLPIPFSNLGMVIEDVMTTSTDSVQSHEDIIKALRLNAHQVRQYLHEYIKVSPEFSSQKMTTLESLFEAVESKYESRKQDDILHLVEIRRDYVKYLQDVRVMCEELWAKFDLASMFLGMYCVCCVVLASALCLYVYTNSYSQELPRAALFAIFAVPGLTVLLMLMEITSALLLVGAAGVTCSAFIFMTRYYLKRMRNNCIRSPFRLVPVTAVVLCAVHIMKVFSNSYIVYDDVSSEFLLITLIFVQFVIINTKLRNSRDQKLDLASGSMELHRRRSNRASSTRDIGYMFTSPRSIAAVLTISLCVVIRVTGSIRACREEQTSCEPSAMLRPLAAMTDRERSWKTTRYFYAVMLLAVIPLLFRCGLKSLGNLNGNTVVAAVVKYGLPLCYVSVAVYWTILAAPPNVVLPSWTQTVFPQFVYVTVFFMICAMLWSPLALYVVTRSSKPQDKPFINPGSENALPQIYDYLKSNWRTMLSSSTTNKRHDDTDSSRSEPEKMSPLVYGLATAYSAPLLTLLAGNYGTTVRQ